MTVMISAFQGNACIQRRRGGVLRVPSLHPLRVPRTSMRAQLVGTLGEQHG